MIKNIFFDFDGVIIDSMPIREYGFREIFKDYDSNLVDKLIEYHEINGGLSRFVKIKYFFEHILNEPVLDNKVTLYANNFSILMKKELTNKKYLIEETIQYIKKIYQQYNLHIVSGSEENELRYLCQELNIDFYFKSIHGSPTHKNILVKNLLVDNNYKKEQTILIGDSINDYEAAKNNELLFYGYNNKLLKNKSDFYIVDFNSI